NGTRRAGPRARGPGHRGARRRGAPRTGRRSRGRRTTGPRSRGARSPGPRTRGARRPGAGGGTSRMASTVIAKAPQGVDASPHAPDAGRTRPLARFPILAVTAAGIAVVAGQMHEALHWTRLQLLSAGALA